MAVTKISVSSCVGSFHRDTFGRLLTLLEASRWVSSSGLLVSRVLGSEASRHFSGRWRHNKEEQSNGRVRKDVLPIGPCVCMSVSCRESRSPIVSQHVLPRWSATIKYPLVCLCGGPRNGQIARLLWAQELQQVRMRFVVDLRVNTPKSFQNKAVQRCSVVVLKVCPDLHSHVALQRRFASPSLYCHLWRFFLFDATVSRAFHGSRGNGIVGSISRCHCVSTSLEDSQARD